MIKFIIQAYIFFGYINRLDNTEPNYKEWIKIYEIKASTNRKDIYLLIVRNVTIKAYILMADTSTLATHLLLEFVMGNDGLFNKLFTWQQDWSAKITNDLQIIYNQLKLYHDFKSIL